MKYPFNVYIWFQINKVETGMWIWIQIHSGQGYKIKEKSRV